MLGPIMLTARLPTIRELITAIANRPGVDAALLLSRDGILIDGRGSPGVDLDQLAAHVPPLVTASEDLSGAVSRGTLMSEVLEYERGFVVVTTLTSDALLVVLLRPSANLGEVIAEIRRHRLHIASIV
jgi:predicted regulator of Ras-like GTPase activity (Roadblock/LC7/MglB family)